MNMRFLRKTRLLPALLLIVPVIANAQSLRDVMVLDHAFDPQVINIQTGDTVRWLAIDLLKQWVRSQKH